MREILFRGKTVKEEWVYGLLSHVGNAWYISDKAGTPLAYEVIPSTVGQYTGLNNERHRLFLGDIVSWNNEIGVVKYGDFNPRYYAKDIYHSCKIKGVFVETVDGKQLVLPTKSRAKIIGNIYDNPDILSNYLAQGYKVVTVNKIADKTCENLEYILELDDKLKRTDGE